jgi:hypothetical protein
LLINIYLFYVGTQATTRSASNRTTETTATAATRASGAKATLAAGSPKGSCSVETRGMIQP